MRTKVIFFAVIAVMSVLVAAGFRSKDTSGSPQITGKDIFIPECTEVPAELRFYNDRTGTLECADLDDALFTPGTTPFTPGFYEGVIWIDFTIPCDYQKYGTDLVADFGNAYLNFSELFLETTKGWKFIGRTGRKLKKSQISTPDWKQVIEFNTRPDKRTEMHLRARVSPCAGASVKLQILPERVFLPKAQIELRYFMLVEGVCLIFSLAFVFIFLMLKDELYILIAIAFYSTVLFNMTTKGIGSLFIWNSFSATDNGYKLLFFFPASSFLFISLATRVIFRKKECIFTMTYIPASVLCALIFPVLLFSSSEKTVFYSFSSLIVLSKLFYLAGFFLSVRKLSVNERIMTLCWQPLILLHLTLEVFNAIQIHTGTNFSFIFDGKLFVPGTAITILSVIPIFYNLGRRHSQRYKVLSKEVKRLSEKEKADEKNKAIQKDNIRSLLVSSDIILGTAEIICNNSSENKTCPYLWTIKYNSAKISDALAVDGIINGILEPENENINIIGFFKDCIESIERNYSSRGILLSTTTMVPSDFIAKADPRIMQFLIMNYAGSALMNSPRGSKIAFVVSGERKLNFEMRLILPTENRRELKEIISECFSENLFIFKMMQRAVKIYGGSLRFKRSEEGIKCSLTLCLEIPDQNSVSVITWHPKLKSGNPFETEFIEGKTSTTKIPEALPRPAAEPTAKKSRDALDDFGLSRREKEIVALIVKGKTNKEIAELTSISAETVATHNKKIFRKMDVHSRVELMNKLSDLQ